MRKRQKRELFHFPGLNLKDVAMVGFVSADTRLSESEWENINARLHNQNGACRCLFAGDLQGQRSLETLQLRKKNQKFRLASVINALAASQIKFVVCFDVQYGLPAPFAVHELLQHMRMQPNLQMIAVAPSVGVGKRVMSIGEAQSTGLVPELRELLIVRFPAQAQLLAWQRSIKPIGVPLSAEPAFLLGSRDEVAIVSLTSGHTRTHSLCCAPFVRFEEQKEELCDTITIHTLCTPRQAQDCVLVCPHVSQHVPKIRKWCSVT
jgi:hypothetical protein